MSPSSLAPLVAPIGLFKSITKFVLLLSTLLLVDGDGSSVDVEAVLGDDDDDFDEFIIDAKLCPVTLSGGCHSITAIQGRSKLEYNLGRISSKLLGCV